MSNNAQKLDPEYLERLDEDHIHVTTRPYLNKVTKHTEPYDVDVFGQKITVMPDVMSPEYDWAGIYMIDWLPKDFTGKDVLELGPGSGLVSVFVGLRGARSVTAADVNPQAVANTKLNLAKFNIPNAKVVQSDVFSAVPKQQYDAIIFNLPYHDAKPVTELEKGVMDPSYTVMTSFFKDAKKFLKPNGVLYVGFSRSGNVPLFLETIKKNGFVVDSMEEKNTWDNDPRFAAPELHYNCQVYKVHAVY